GALSAARRDRARSRGFAALFGPLRAGLLYAKVCAEREDFGDATGARTFLSAATSNGSKTLELSDPVDHSGVAADKNVRAPLSFRLRRPEDPARRDALR